MNLQAQLYLPYILVEDTYNYIPININMIHLFHCLSKKQQQQTVKSNKTNIRISL